MAQKKQAEALSLAQLLAEQPSRGQCSVLSLNCAAGVGGTEPTGERLPAVKDTWTVFQNQS
jgi:hypothetical protein